MYGIERSDISLLLGCVRRPTDGVSSLVYIVPVAARSAKPVVQLERNGSAERRNHGYLIRVSPRPGLWLRIYSPDVPPVCRRRYE